MSTRKYFSFDSSTWKTHPNYEFSRFRGTVERTSDVLRKALFSYERTLIYPERLKIVIPEECKSLIEETEDAHTLSSALFKSLKEYVTSLDWTMDLRLSYARITEIENLKFPTAQIIPDGDNRLKFYTRMFRALLHALSYPGLTICRCEMDAERNTSLLLFSFFDWFAILHPGSSTNETIDSIRVFKRDSHPEWTRDGLVPIVFYPQQLQPISERKIVAAALQSYQPDERPVPEVLWPLVAAVERTLRLLLAHAISDWKRKRKIDDVDEGFVVPDWLFIHGLVYDALGINIYTFAPKIMRCDDGGMPVEWEFACIPQRIVPELAFFRNRHVFRRVGNAAALLAIRRHTKRICNVLDNLDLDPAVAPIILESDEKFECDCDEVIKNTDTAKKKAVDDVQDSEAAEAATKCLLACVHRTGLGCSSGNHTSDEWSFAYNPSDITYDTISESREFIATLMDNWQTRDSKKLYLPEDWLTTMPDPEYPMVSCQLFQILPKVFLHMWTLKCKEHFAMLTPEALQERHFDPHSFAPDFYLSTPARVERPIDCHDPPSIENLCPDTVHSLEHFKDIYQYVSHEYEAKMAMSSPFMCTPGCWLKYDTQLRFPTAFATDSPPVDFSLLLHPIQTVPIEMTPLTYDINLRATILNPALIVVIQGPTPWPDEFACSPASPQSQLRPKDKADALHRLAKAIEPSLKTHLINWQLRFEQGLVPTRDLPPWFMLFGIIYDAKEVTIVAHIPHMTNDRYSFISYIVDTISFPPVDPSAKLTDPWFLDRFRVGLALLSLQKHAFHMAELWECVVWPDELVSWEEIIEREYLGPVLTPLERGYMVEPGPMTQLYLEMHGSDETLFDHSGEVSDCGEEDSKMRDEDDEEDDEEDSGEDGEEE